MAKTCGPCSPAERASKKASFSMQIAQKLATAIARTAPVLRELSENVFELSRLVRWHSVRDEPAKAAKSAVAAVHAAQKLANAIAKQAPELRELAEAVVAQTLTTREAAYAAVAVKQAA